VVVVGVDRAGRVQVFNSEARRLSGLAGKDVIGRSYDELRAAVEGLPMLLPAPGTRPAPEIGGDECESSIVCPDGRQRRIAWTLTGATATSGPEAYAIAFGRDITESRVVWQNLRATERKLSLHLQFHDRDSQCHCGESAQTVVHATTGERLLGPHDLQSPNAGDNPAVRINSGSDAAYICVRGQISDANLVNCPVFAAVYRTQAEIPATPPSGAPSGIVNSLTGMYEIPRVENVLIGSSNINWLGVWPRDPSGAVRHFRDRQFLAAESPTTFCQQMALPTLPVAIAATAPEVYLASIASPEDLLARWPDEPIALKRVTRDLWSAHGPWQMQLRVFHGACGVEAELVISALGGAPLKSPEIWRAAPFHAGENNIFYWMTKDASIHVPAAILLKPL
jgi:PAS domain S-box-containing protein